MPDSEAMRTIVVDPEHPETELLQPAADTIRAGGLVAFPTETVYGLGALAFDPVAVAGIFTAKGRPSEDPLIVHVLPHWNLELLFSDVSTLIRELVAEHWPGPLTVVGPKQPTVPDIVTAGRATVAVRAPSHPVAVMLLDLVGEPIAAPSANRFSHVSPTTAAHVAADLGDSIDVLVDAGSTPIGIESTIVSVVDGEVMVLRPGTAQIAGARYDAHATSSAAPGRMETHYAPHSPTRVLEAKGRISEEVERGVFIGFDDSAPLPGGWRSVSLGDRRDVDNVARILYAVLREVDRHRPPAIVIECTGLTGVGHAIDDRIRRSAGGQTVN
jgi:L-threonylcarbamoyladenylate synthase